MHPHLIAWSLVVCNIMLIMGSDIHLPALPFLVADLGGTEFQGQLVFLIFFVGASFSRLIWGPISDKFGRRRVMFILLGLQIPTQIMCIFAQDIMSLIFWRALQSLGAGIISVVGTAIIADIFREKNRAKYYALLELSFPIGFMIAPVLGAWLLEYTGSWRAGFIFFLGLLFLVLIICYFVIPETNKVKSNDVISLGSYITVMTNLDFFVYTSVVSLIIASYILYVVNAPFIFISDYSISPTVYSIYQLLPMLFNLLGLLIYRYILNSNSIYNASKIGMKALTAVLPFYLFFAVSPVTLEPWMIVAAVCLQSLIVPLIIPGLTSMAMDLYPNSRGLASSCIAGFRSFYQVAVSVSFGYFMSTTTSYIFMMKFLIVFSAIVSFFWLARKSNHIKI